MRSGDRHRRVALAAAALFAGLVIAAAASLAPIQDETYYWAWSRALAPSYVDHPPGVAWVLAASRAIFGDGLLALRAASLAAMLATATFVALAARRLAAGAAWRAMLLLVAAPMFSIGYLPATPDPFQGAAIAAAAYFVIRAFEDERWAAPAAFTLIAATIFKHSSAVIAAGAFLGALATLRGRELLARRSTWLGAALGIALLVPWLAADLPDGSIAFQTERVLTRGEHRPLLAVPYVIGGVAVAAGPAGLTALASIRRSPITIVLVSGAALLLLACLIPVAAGGGELNWSMPAYVFMLPACAAAPCSSLTRALAIGSAIIVAALLVHIAQPYLPIHPAKDTTLRGAGFDALAERARALDPAAIITRRYQPASELRYHLGDAIPVYELGANRRSQYDRWPKPTLAAGDDVLLVLNTTELPRELALESISEPIIHQRKARDEVVETWYLRTARVQGGSP